MWKKIERFMGNYGIPLLVVVMTAIMIVGAFFGGIKHASTQDGKLTQITVKCPFCEKTLNIRAKVFSEAENEQK